MAASSNWSRRIAVGGAAVAIAMLGSFYSLVASAVDRGERRAPAVGQSDIDEDLRTPTQPVVTARATAPR